MVTGNDSHRWTFLHVCNQKHFSSHFRFIDVKLADLWPLTALWVKLALDDSRNISAAFAMRLFSCQSFWITMKMKGSRTDVESVAVNDLIRLLDLKSKFRIQLHLIWKVTTDGFESNFIHSAITTVSWSSTDDGDLSLRVNLWLCWSQFSNQSLFLNSGFSESASWIRAQVSHQQVLDGNMISRFMLCLRTCVQRREILISGQNEVNHECV